MIFDILLILVLGLLAIQALAIVWFVFELVWTLLVGVFMLVKKVHP